MVKNNLGRNYLNSINNISTLLNDIKSKNKFTSNKVNEIKVSLQDIKENFNEFYFKKISYENFIKDNWLKLKDDSNQTKDNDIAILGDPDWRSSDRVHKRPSEREGEILGELTNGARNRVRHCQRS